MWALLPVKRFATGKSRLAGVLSATQRAELTCRMLEDVLSVLQSARCVNRVLVLSNEDGLDGVLNAVRVERCREAREGSLNRSLMAAVADLPFSAGRVLILPSDVPAVCAADVEALSEAHTDGVALCPGTIDGGTNALVSTLPLPISLQFGEESLVRHLHGARCSGVPARVIPRHGLERDMDRPDDLDWLIESRHSGRAASYVRTLLRSHAEREAG